MGDAGIIRNRLKIEAAIHNAGVFLNLREIHGSVAEWLASHHPKSKEDWVRLLKKTFRFTGGEITGEFLMGIGYLPGSHDPECPAYDRILRLDPSVDPSDLRGIVTEALSEDRRDEHTWTARHYSPPWWLSGAHAQTLAGKYFRASPSGMLTTERIETPDGDFLDLDWMPETDPSAPLVLVLHGLEGHTRRGYMVQTFLALANRGIRAVGLNFRGCSGEVNRLARFYHSGETGDVGFVIDLLRGRFPTRLLTAIGISLGGNVLLKYLGEQGAKNVTPLSAAVAISVPYDLSAGTDALARGGMARVYVAYFLRSLLAKVRAKREMLADVLDLDTVLGSTTLREFDDAATAKLHGFEDAEDYYLRSSSKGFLQSIRVPTLLLHSLDDPFLPKAALPISTIEASPFLTLILTEGGGHVGFFESGPPWNPAFWMEEQSASFLAHHHPGTSATTGHTNPSAPGWVDPNAENI
jgi:predicted alpha/beta-fold hydrolase